MRAKKHFRVSFVVIPCLVLSTVFGAFGIEKTMAYFSNETTRSYTIYPYSGGGEVSLTMLSDGITSTVKDYQADKPITFKTKFTNTTNATITKLNYSLECNATTISGSADTVVEIAPGESWQQDYTMTASEAASLLGSGGDKTVTVNVTPTSFLSSDGSTEYAVAQNANITVRVLKPATSSVVIRNGGA